MSHKVIGFRLTGNPAIICDLTNELKINPTNTFEIQLFPGKSPTAILTHLKRSEIRILPIELPKELERISYEKAYVFFVQNDVKLIISEEGYEKVGNKRITVKWGDSSRYCPLNVQILLQGEIENKNYRIYLQPLKMEFSQAEIQEKRDEEYLPFPLVFQEIEHEKEKTILTILHKLAPHNFHVEKTAHSLSIRLGPALFQFISNPKLLYKAKAQKTALHPSDTPEEVDTEWVDLENEERREAEEALLSSVQSKEEFLKEIEALVYTLSNSEYFNEFTASLDSLSKSCLIDQEALELINQILQRFIHWFRNGKEANQKKEKKFQWKPSFLFSQK